MSEIKVLKGSLKEQDGFFAQEVVIEKLPSPDHMGEITALYREILENAERQQLSTLVFPAIPRTDPNSLMFQAISMIYKTIREFTDRPYPKEVCIVCEEDDVYNLYMVVWNLYYATTKSGRMNDGRWD